MEGMDRMEGVDRMGGVEVPTRQGSVGSFLISAQSPPSSNVQHRWATPSTAWGLDKVYDIVA